MLEPGPECAGGPSTDYEALATRRPPSHHRPIPIVLANTTWLSGRCWRHEAAHGWLVLATGNKFAPTTVATGSVNRAGSQLSGSLTKAGKQFSSSLNQISSSLSKKVSDNVQNALGSFGKKKKQNSDPGSDGETGGDS